MAKKTDAKKRKEERKNYQKLERRLILLGWLNTKFGYPENSELVESLSEVGEGFDSDGQSFVVGHLLSRGEKCKISRELLQGYDANIGRHLAHINRRRTRPIVLRYFQHLALLYAEIYLDAYFRHPEKLLAELNDYVDDRNIDKLPGEPESPMFTEDDLRKLAFWMATGSGKTLIFHINYLQYLHYGKQAGQEIDNILLVTPNKSLSEQHMDEMVDSDIAFRRFRLQGTRDTRPNVVNVIEITLLVTEKKGSGESVPVEAFEGNNLIFVDEGHKGTGSESETWRKRRAALAETGFTFEYSATFGQALDASKKDDVTSEYAKSIVFDYSYKYFYGDGYGKDFHILNLKDYENTDSVHTLLLANLLSFYEQRKFYADNKSKVREYLLEPPLWMQICRTVATSKAEILKVIEFLDRFLKNKRGWSTKTIDKILQGKSGIETNDVPPADLFDGQLTYIRKGRNLPKGEKVFNDVLKHVFQSPDGGTLQVATIKSAKDEVGLRVSGCETYFGLLNIGDVSKFKGVLTEEAPDIDLSADAISPPIFPGVKKANSKVNLLIGAKKFMEGWSSWRVSNIGLLNVGVSEGSEIIQLFGRGVRLKGLDFNLKRSTSIPGVTHPKHIALLERLNIFAVRANYMSRFRDYLEREGIDTGGYIEMQLPLWANKPLVEKKLYRPRIPTDVNFADDYRICLEFDDAFKVRHDVSMRLATISSVKDGGIAASKASAGAPQRVKPEMLELLDWQRVHVDLLKYKEGRGYHNLTIPHPTPKAIMLRFDPMAYELTAPESVVQPKTRYGVDQLQETVTSVLRKYVDRFYHQRQKKWESSKLVYDELMVNEPNFQPYMVSVPRSDPHLVATIHDIVTEAKKLAKKKIPEKIFAGEYQFELPNVFFDRHLYLPLLIKSKSMGIKTSPQGLNTGEKQFVDDLKSYCKKEAGGALKGKELFLLRNHGRGKGIGFFQSRGFFPDFILWIKESRKQRLIFVEPHGMMMERGGFNSEKVDLHKRLREYSETALRKSKLKNLSVDACVISVSGYDEVSAQHTRDDGSKYSRTELSEKRVLFPDRIDDYDYIERILTG